MTDPYDTATLGRQPHGPARSDSRGEDLLAWLAQLALRPDVPVERHGGDPEFTSERGYGGVAVRHRGLGQPVPIDLNTLRAMKRSPLGLDLYLWLTYRTFGLKRPLRLTEILSKVVDGVSSGGFLSDAIDEGHAIDDLDDQLSPVQCSPLFLRGQSQLEDHR